MVKISPENSVFVLLSFEGPDQYSLAGGLGTRMNHLGEALAESGIETHLFFVGDPYRPGVATRREGRYTLHRWCQWISRHHTKGVYDGEEGKVADFTKSVPPFIEKEIVRRAAGEGKWTIVMAEEWQTADALMELSDRLHKSGLRERALFLWNANNIMSFDRINWGRLKYVAAITAVSKFMKHILWQQGLDPIVVPNGIPNDLLEPLDRGLVRKTSNALKAHGRDLNILKIGRFDPAKRWMMAVEAVARLKGRGIRPLFLMRGGIEPHGAEVLGAASALGLKVHDIVAKKPGPNGCIELIANAPRADVLNLRFFLPDEFVRLLYRGCDCVLANSGFEPFGLVGLEVMAAGGIAFTGTTGEDYVIPFVNAVSVETNDPGEMLSYMLHLHGDPGLRKSIKREARKTAEAYKWSRVINNLFCRLEFVAGERGGDS